MIDELNILILSYRIARDRIKKDELKIVRLRLIKNRSTNEKIYNPPNISEVAALIVGNFDTQKSMRDIIIEIQSK